MRDVAVSSDGITVSFEVHGSGTPTLVFVHGWLCDGSYWRGQLGSFAEQYQVVAIDLAGHGKSGTGRASWTMAAFGEDVAAVIEHLGVRETVLIGHSMGGDVIVETALRLPTQVTGLVWVDTYSSLDEPRTREMIQAFLVPFREDFVPATRELVRRMFLRDADPGLVEWVATDMASALRRSRSTHWSVPSATMGRSWRGCVT
jgi:pimeloyl-ACP methyl ester carboxylesterase